MPYGFMPLKKAKYAEKHGLIKNMLVDLKVTAFTGLVLICAIKERK
jgi:hypothetical protein